MSLPMLDYHSFTSGLVLYFAYGIWNSVEGRSIKYGPMVTYTGDADLSQGSLARLDEEVVHQQPQLEEKTDNKDVQ